MNRERLTILATFLATIPPERFDLGTWAGNDKIHWGGEKDLSCGTTACAMGWAATIPEFQALGLHLEIPAHGFAQNGFAQIRFGNEIAFAAAAEFMDLTPRETDYLFDPDYYDDGATPAEVIARINQFLLDGKTVREEETEYEEVDDH